MPCARFKKLTGKWPALLAGIAAERRVGSLAKFLNSFSEKMQIVNLTPHAVQVGAKSFPPSGNLARCEETWQTEIENDGVNFLVGFKYGKTNLPAADGETLYIVSLPVALAELSRTDLLISVGQIRDTEGRIIGAKGLARL